MRWVLAAVAAAIVLIGTGARAQQTDAYGWINVGVQGTVNIAVQRASGDRWWIRLTGATSVAGIYQVACSALSTRQIQRTTYTGPWLTGAAYPETGEHGWWDYAIPGTPNWIAVNFICRSTLTNPSASNSDSMRDRIAELFAGTQPRLSQAEGVARTQTAAGTVIESHTQGAGNQFAQPPASTTAVPVSGCSETGSCYGDISPTTGQPRTTYVQGYYRRNGTYVGSYYRSRGRR